MSDGLSFHTAAGYCDYGDTASVNSMVCCWLFNSWWDECPGKWEMGHCNQNVALELALHSVSLLLSYIPAFVLIASFLPTYWHSLSSPLENKPVYEKHHHPRLEEWWELSRWHFTLTTTVDGAWEKGQEGGLWGWGGALSSKGSWPPGARRPQKTIWPLPPGRLVHEPPRTKDTLPSA